MLTSATESKPLPVDLSPKSVGCKMQCSLDQINRGLACLLAFAIPIATAATNIVFYTMLVLFLASGQWRAKWRSVRASSLVQAALVLFVLIWLSVLYSVAGLHGGVQMASKYDKLLLVPILAYLFRDQRSIKPALWALAGALLLTLLAGYAKFYGVAPTFIAHIRLTPANPFIQHIETNMLMAMLAFAFLYFLVRDGVPWQWRVLLIVALAITVHYVLFMNIARSGYLVFLGSIVLLLYILLRHRHYRRAVAIVVVAVLSFALAAQYAAVFRSRIMAGDSDLHQYQQGQTATSLGNRLAVYDHTFEIMHDHWLIGVGAGGFQVRYQELVNRLHLQTEMANPFNQYLDTAAEQGLIGLAALLWLYWSLWGARDRQDEYASVVAQLAFVAMVLGSLVNSWLMDFNAGFAICLLAGLSTRKTQCKALSSG